MAYNAGTAYMQVVPSFRGMVEAVTQEATKDGKAYSSAFSRSVETSLRGVRLGPSDTEAARQGRSSGGAFADAFKAHVSAALRNLPEPRVGVDATELDAELADIRARLQALRDVRVGVDLQAAEALAELDRLKLRLDELGARSPDIRVQVDSARASAELALVREEVDRLDGKTAKIDVDTSNALSGISGLSAAIAGLGPVLIPIGAVAVGSLGGIATAALAGGAGLGVLALAASGVSNAVKLLNKQQQESETQAIKTGGAQSAAANQIAGAQDALANARANAADAAVTAAERVQNAEISLTAANRQAADAQKALNDAREQAIRDLQDIANRARDAQLSVRQAELDLKQAQANLASLGSQPFQPGQVGIAPGVTDLQRQQGVLAVAEAQQRLKEAQLEAARAAVDNTAAQKAGIAGDRNYVSAQQQVINAVNQQRQAQQSLADAQRAQATQSRQAAYAIASAERQLANAMQTTGTTGSTALKKVQQDLAKVPPATLALAKLWENTLKPAFDNLKNAAAAGLAPGITAGIKALTPLIGPLTTFVSGLAAVMGQLFAQAAKALTAPFWRQFFGYLTATVGPTLATMGGIFGNLAKGFAGLLEAFAPVAEQMGRGLLHLTQRFADWASTLGQNADFQKFIAYVQTNGPQLVRMFEQLGIFVGRFLVALAPLGAALVPIITDITKFLSALSPDELLAIVAAVTALVFIFTGSPLALVVSLAAVAALAFDLARHWRQYWDDIKNVAYAAWAFIKRNMDLILLALIPLTGGLAAIGLAAHLLYENWTTIWNGIKSVVFDAVRAIGGFLISSAQIWLSTIGAVVGALAHLPGPLGAPFQAAKKLIDEANGALDDMRRRLDDLGKTPHTIPIELSLFENVVHVTARAGGYGLYAKGGVVPHFAPGGFVPGYAPGMDSILAMLSPGEAVLRPEAVRYLGKSTIDALNSAAASGRLVGAPQVQAVVSGASGGAQVSYEQARLQARLTAYEMSRVRLAADVDATLRAHPTAQPVLSRIPTMTG